MLNYPPNSLFVDGDIYLSFKWTGDCKSPPSKLRVLRFRLFCVQCFVLDKILVPEEISFEVSIILNIIMKMTMVV